MGGNYRYDATIDVTDHTAPEGDLDALMKDAGLSWDDTWGTRLIYRNREIGKINQCFPDFYEGEVVDFMDDPKILIVSRRSKPSVDGVRHADATASLLAARWQIVRTAIAWLGGPDQAASDLMTYATKGIAEGYDLDTGLPNPAFAIAVYQVTNEGRSECIGYVDQNAEWSEEFPTFSIFEAVNYAQALNERDIREPLVYCAELVK